MADPRESPGEILCQLGLPTQLTHFAVQLIPLCFWTPQVVLSWVAVGCGLKRSGKRMSNRFWKSETTSISTLAICSGRVRRPISTNLGRHNDCEIWTWNFESKARSRTLFDDRPELLVSLPRAPLEPLGSRASLGVQLQFHGCRWMPCGVCTRVAVWNCYSVCGCACCTYHHDVFPIYLLICLNSLSV